jgi:hypothetical protein
MLAFEASGASLRNSKKRQFGVASTTRPTQSITRGKKFFTIFLVLASISVIKLVNE